MVEATDPVGPPVIRVSGGTVSTVNERVAGVVSGAPLTSSARTSKVCGPWFSATVVCGEVQLANAARRRGTRSPPRR